MQIDFAKCSFGQEEINAVNQVLQGTWLASGQENEAFEKEFADYVGVDYAIVVNSGSSANLISLAALELAKGSRVLTSACGFPATLSPILHLHLQPVLVDYNLATHNIDIEQTIDKLSEVDAIIFAHTLGNPVDTAIVEKAYSLGIPVIEDCCEAAGTKINNKTVGSFGTLGTFSFYPAHQITALGGGGMITTDDEVLMKRIKSMRDWGKMWDWDSDKGGVHTCYTSDIDGMKYYKGYTYETLGYNFKLPEANCAFGRKQLKKLDSFVEQRKENWHYLNSQIDCDCFLKLSIDWNAEISWFGYPLTLKDGFGSRNELGDFLEGSGIRHRPFFAGNILRHKPFKNLTYGYTENYPVADKLMRDTLFVGCWPGMTIEMLDYIVKKVKKWASFQLPSSTITD